MDNKDKIIEEMTKELEKDINTPMYSYHYLATKLQPKGWVKLPKDSVVLSREEYVKLCGEAYDTRLQVHFERNKVSKETAEKIIDLIKTFCPDKKFIETISHIISERFGVEIKE